MTAPSASMAPAITHWRSTTKTATETASGTTAAHPPITAPLLVRASPVHDGTGRAPAGLAVGAPVRRDGVREPLAHRRDDDPRQRKHDGRPRDGQDQVPPRRVVQGPEPGPIAGHAATSVVG